MTEYEMQLVGPGKKYASIEALEASRVEADRFIDQLQEEQTRLRDELDQRLTYEELMDHINNRSKAEERPLADNQPHQVAPKTEDTAITPQDVERIVEQRERRARYDANKQNTLAQYAEVNGPNHAQKLKQQAQELGMNEIDLQNLAGNNPKAFARLTGLDTQEKPTNFTSPPRTQMNTEAFLSSQPTTNPVAVPFKELYKTNRSEYFTPKVQNQIFKLVAEGKLSTDEIY